MHQPKLNFLEKIQKKIKQLKEEQEGYKVTSTDAPNSQERLRRFQRIAQKQDLFAFR